MLGKLKSIIKQLIPPIFFRLLIKTKPKRYFWTGVYKDFSDLEGCGSYNNESLANELIAASLSLKKKSPDLLSRSADILPHNSILSIICCIYSLDEKKTEIRIVDFGGGVALEYMLVRKTLVRNIKLRFWIVELECLKEIINSIQEGHDEVVFCPSFPENAKPDIIFSSTAIQYVDNWRFLIEEMCTKDAKIIVLLRLVAGKNKTFVARQENLNNVKLPYRFFNFDELKKEFLNHNYDLAFLARSEKQYDQTNYPEEYRIDRPCNAIFVKR